ncbi:uncharacterized protein K02A2.6-like [Physella acuta]|uniref:uncharacterized protein K02A2.6-like n=1 Tax=Physella acuta TaxID=109671 RepID=UPI0027DBA4A8|nr:uncharacterized protein K02A2.6-like [Physella acuta]
MVQTRRQSKEEIIKEMGAMKIEGGLSEKKIKEESSTVQESLNNASLWTPTQFQEEQRKDHSLEKIFKLAKKNSRTFSKTTEHGFIVKDNTLMRIFRDHTKEYKQLVIPHRYRNIILSQAHDLCLAGHMGRRKTKQRIQSAFYWPGMDRDISEYIQSCKLCMNKTRTPQLAPIQKTDLVCRPFEKIAIDIIGPLQPTSARGHRFVLTVVDLATRWPEAFPLKNTTSEDTVNCLIQVFSRAGFPDTILSERGPQFTSEITRQISCLLGIKQTFTSPYHPESNGICERLNGTIKTMMGKIPKRNANEWDLYLPCLLFAYREVPHSITGFSPFELVFGANPKGPMDIMKSLLVDDRLNPEMKSTYERVINLRHQIIGSCEIAKASIEDKANRYRSKMNVGRHVRKFKVGDQVRILLPSRENKLQLAWMGPYTISRIVTNVDYEIMIKDKKKIFHVNILSPFHMRPSDLEVPEYTATINCAVVSDDTDQDDTYEIRTIPVNNESFRDIDLKHIPEEFQERIEQLLSKYQETLSAVPGRTNTIEHEIKVISDTPIKLKPYEIPLHYRDQVQKEINELTETGTIEMSDSPYVS